MTRLRTTIAATLLAAVALSAPAASHAADDLADLQANPPTLVDLGDDDPVVTDPGNELISLLGWGWGG